MEDNKEKTEIQSPSEQIDDDEQVQEEMQQEQEVHELTQPDIQIIQIEEEKIEETTPEDVQTETAFEEPKHEKEVRSYSAPVTRIGFFVRGALAISLGAIMFLYQDETLRILGILLGCAIVLMSGLNLIIGYRDRLTKFYGRWLIIAGVIGMSLGVIVVCVPLLISAFIFLFLTLALVVLGCGDIVLAMYVKKTPEVRRTLVLLGLLSIAAGSLIYMDPNNLIVFFCIYAVASGVLSIAISLFMKSKKESPS